MTVTTKYTTDPMSYANLPMTRGALFGVSPNQFWVDPGLPVQTAKTRPLSTLVRDSVSTPGYHTKKTRRVEWKPKKFPLRAPVQPRFNPPRLLRALKEARPLKAPLVVGLTPREARALIRNYQKRKQRMEEKRRLLVKKWTTAQLARLQLRSLYLEKYRARRVVYETRLKKYQALVKLRQDGLLRFKRVVTKAKRLRNNPYSKTKTTDLGWIVDCNWGVPCLVRRNSPTSFSVIANRYGSHWIKLRAMKGYYGASGTSFNDAEGYLGSLSHGTLSAANLIAMSDDAAVASLYEKLNDQVVHLAQIVAERAQTAEMITGTVIRIAKLITSPRKMLLSFVNGNMGKTAAKTVSNDYLALQFGVKPLLSDVYGAAVSLARLSVDQQTDRVVVRSRKTRRDFMNVSTSTFDTATKKLVHVEVTVSYVLEYKIQNGLSSELQKFGLINPAEIAWELMPWSFVVDWFLPIGNYITSLSADCGLTFATGTKTITTKTIQTTRQDYNGAFQNGSDGENRRKGYIEGNRIVETQVRTVLSVPPLTRLPAFKNPFSSSHFKLALALLTQKAR